MAEEFEEQTSNINVRINDLDLDTYVGQNTLLLRLEEIVSQGGLTFLDMRNASLLKDLIKVKKDIDTLKVVLEMKDELARLKNERKSS